MSDQRIRNARRGVGLLEMLIALAIGGIVLGVAAAFFGQQSRVSRDTQTRNEINVRARAVVEAIVQDLKLAGARAVVDGSGQTSFRRNLPCDAEDTCVVVGGSEDDFLVEMEYVSSLFLTGPIVVDVNGVVPGVCRNVRYALDATGTLHRSDVGCGGTHVIGGFATEFATDVTRVDFEFVCGAGGTTSDVSTCFAGGDGFVREGRVEVTLASPRSAATLTLDSATSMLNMRAPDRFAEVE